MRRAVAIVLAVVLESACGSWKGDVKSVERFVREQTFPEPPTSPDMISPAKNKDLPAISPTFAESLVVNRKVDHVRLTVFDAADAVVPGDTVSSMKSPLSRVKLADPVFLIRHPVQGLILVDTGPGPTPPGRKPRRFVSGPGQDIVSRLRRSGVDPSSIRCVISTHLHYDHAGMIAKFPNARWLVDVREWRAARAAQGVDADYIDLRSLNGRLPEAVDLSTAPSYGLFDHGRDLFGDGTVVLLDLSGHTAGNLGVWLNMDEGPVLITGGAADVWDNYNDLALPEKPREFDVKEYERRLREIHGMEQLLPDLMIIPSHDLSPMRLLERDDVAQAS